MVEENSEVYEEVNFVRGKLEVVKSERSPKVAITVSASLPFERKEEIAPAVIELCKRLWDKYNQELR